MGSRVLGLRCWVEGCGLRVLGLKVKGQEVRVNG